MKRQVMVDQDILTRPRTHCWNWPPSGRKTKHPPEKIYPVLSIEGKSVRVSHYVLEQILGRPLTQWVLHTCDNPRCYNPDHLYEGSAQDNADDTVRRGRHSYGENHPTHKLTKEQVRAIRRDPRAMSVVAREYNVHRQSI